MRDNKDLLRLLVASCILIALVTGLVAVITSVSLLPVNTDNAWIGYYGGIIGSIVTLLGVVMTLQENRKQEQRNLEMQYKPILIISFRGEQGIWSDKENKQLINGNFHDCIPLFREEAEEDDGIGFSAEIMLESVNGLAQKVMFEVYVDNVKKYDKSNDRLIVVGREPFYYYINTWQKSVNEEHKIVLKIYYQDIFKHQYEQEVSYETKNGNIENVEVKYPKTKIT